MGRLKQYTTPSTQWITYRGEVHPNPPLSKVFYREKEFYKDSGRVLALRNQWEPNEKPRHQMQ
eukprot:8748698-Prorocentrum_lima.AAC.1